MKPFQIMAKQIKQKDKKACTFAEYKERNNDSSWASLVEHAIEAQHITDDEEFRLAATALVQAEDKFYELFLEREMELG